MSDVASRRSNDIASAPGQSTWRRLLTATRIPNAAARSATARPIRPAPMIPSCLPRRLVPSMKSNAHPFHAPRRTMRSPSPSRRVMARIKRPRVVGDRVGQHVRRVRAHDPLRACVGDVEVVVADRHVRDHLQVGTRIDGWGIQPVAEEHDDALLAPQPIVQLAWREGCLARVHVDLELLFEQRQGSGGKPAGDENGGAHRHILGRNRAVPQAAACDRRS